MSSIFTAIVAAFVDDMSKHAIELLQDPDLLAKYKNQAYERSREFDIDKILPLYEQFYEEIRSSV